MKKKIAILGSTGSIGKSLLKIISNDKKNFNIVLLSANKNYKGLLKQANEFNVKNLIIADPKSYKKIKYQLKNSKIKIFHNYDFLNDILKDKVDYVMSSIVGIDGLSPTIKVIKHTKNIAIANKEAIICGWSLIKKEIKKYKTNFLPVDSEHFSIWYSLLGKSTNNIDKIYLTASGGPLLNFPLHKFNNIKVKHALNHPNCKMGKKISIDSATMMNKVFEIIEASKIFNISYKKLSILIHPSSYVHAIIKFNSGMTKIIAHDTTMKIPIFNTLYHDVIKKLKTMDLDIKKLNNLNLAKVNRKRFPITKILDYCSNKNSMFETIIVSANDELVNLYLNNKIKFKDISIMLIKFINRREFDCYKKIKPKTSVSIEKLSKYVRLKISSMSI